MDSKLLKSKKTPKHRNDTAVQGTNDSSIVSKLSAVVQGYVCDEYLQYMVSKSSRRAPLINRGYYIRHRSIDYVIKKFLSNFPDGNQVLNLGAGFDTTYFRFADQSLLFSTKYFEVDFPDVARRKLALINKHEALSSHITEQRLTDSRNVVLNTQTYKLLGVDMSNLDLFHTTLNEAEFDCTKPTFVLSEVVLTYMTADRSSKVIGWAASLLHHGLFLVYEQIYPDDAFGRVMINHFDKIGSSLKTIKTYPTLKDQVDRYMKLGWEFVRSMDINFFYHHHVSADERHKVDVLELFDEYEEWQLKCAHYMLLTAYKGSCKAMDKVLWNQDSGNNGLNALSNDYLGDMFYSESFGMEPVVNETVINSSMADVGNETICKRFGHTCTLFAFKLQADLQDLNLVDNRIMDIYSNEGLFESLHEPSLTSQNASNSFSAESENIHHNLILMMGGFGEENSQHTRVKTLHLLSPTNWQAVAVECSGDEFNFDCMFHSATCIDNNKIVVLGGRFSPVRPCDMNSVCVLTFPATRGDDGSPVACKCNVQPTGGTTPCSRWRHSTTLVTWGDRKSLLLHGGCSRDQKVLNDLYLLDINTWMWTILQTTGLERCATHSHSADNWRDSVVFSCGLSENEIPQNTVFCLKHVAARSLEWTKLALTGRLQARYSHSSAVIGDSLLLVGGVSLQYPPPGVAKISLITGAVQEYHVQVPRDDIFMLHNHASVLLPGGDSQKLVILGGGGNCFSFGTHLNKAPLVIDVNDLIKNESSGESSDIPGS